MEIKNKMETKQFKFKTEEIKELWKKYNIDLDDSKLQVLANEINEKFEEFIQRLKSKGNYCPCNVCKTWRAEIDSLAGDNLK